MTGHQPYAGVESDEAQPRCREEDFPDATNLACGGLILMCWNREVNSAGQVRKAVEALLQQSE